MKKSLLLLFCVAFGSAAIAQDLSNCKKTCTRQKLVETGAFLGVRIITAENNIHTKVLEVVPNTAAERNHFAVNDVITKIDGITVKGRLHITEIIKAHQPNDVIKIEYLHENKAKKKRVVLGALHSEMVTETICCDEVVQTNPKIKNSLVPAKVQFVLYPNPAVSELQITSDLQISGPVEIKIYDMLGSQMLSENVTISESVLNQKVNLKGFASGSYIVKITNNDIVATQNLVITK